MVTASGCKLTELLPHSQWRQYRTLCCFSLGQFNGFPSASHQFPILFSMTRITSVLRCNCGDFKRKLLTYQKPLCILSSWGPSHSPPDNHTWSCPLGSGTPESRCRGQHTRQCLQQKTDLMSNTNSKDSTCSLVSYFLGWLRQNFVVFLLQNTIFNAQKSGLLAVKLNRASQNRKTAHLEMEWDWSKGLPSSI